MQFSEADLKAMQFPNSEHYNMSATCSASMTMHNCGKTHKLIDKRRRVDGTVTAADVKAIFHETEVKIDDWAHGEVNFHELAIHFNEERDPEPLADAVRDSLVSMTITDNKVKLASQLSQKDYAKVNKILEGLGGKWNRKAGAHIFEDVDPEEAVANFLETGKLEKPKKFGFFPTPEKLARELVLRAGLQPGDTVLEPEAGVGGLATICAEVVGTENVTCYEIQPKNCAVLRNLGFKVTQADFLAIEPVEQFTHVILNPPFENQADIDHVMHAFRFLAPGGTMAAIMSIGVTFRTNRKTSEFRTFLDSMGAQIIVNDKDAFKESGTAAQTVTITFQKPCVADSAVPVRSAIPQQAPRLAPAAVPTMAPNCSADALAQAMAIVSRIQPKHQPVQASLF